MLAIDRLKKLKTAAKRNAQQNVELYQASPLSAEQYSSMCEGHPLSNVMYHSPSRPYIGLPKSPSYFLSADGNIYHRSGGSHYDVPARSLAAYQQPEMVAIQVKRSTDVQSPPIYDVPLQSPAGYESFHGVPVRDGGVGRVESPYADMGVMRMRRASGNSHGFTPCNAGPCPMMTPASCVGVGNVRLPLSRGSAPSTPLHVTSRLTPSTITPKKIPPVPPQRTNSVKVSDSPLLADINSRPCSLQSRLVNYGSLDRMSRSRQHDAVATPNTVTCSATTSPTAAVMSPVVEAGSTGDCSTLPFANENIGTIRQRGSLNSASAERGVNSGDDDNDDGDDGPVYHEYSGTVRRRGMCVKLCLSSFFYKFRICLISSLHLFSMH